MVNKEFINQLFKNWNNRVLLVELILFCVILGVLPYMWPIACLIFMGSCIVLTKPKGPLYVVYILSGGWAFLSTMGAYFIGGWGWGIGMGIFVLFWSMNLHFRSLKQPLYEKVFKEEKFADNFKWFLRWQNLN